MKTLSFYNILSLILLYHSNGKKRNEIKALNAVWKNNQPKVN